MTLRSKLYLGFGLAALVSGVVGYQAITKVEELARPLRYEIPTAYEVLERTSHLFNEAQLIRYYDEVLTQSARNYAFTQDEKWVDRYGDIEPLLDRAIKRALGDGDETGRQLFSQIDSSNMALVEMEYTAISLVDRGQAAEAVAILESDEYWNQKEIYWNGLKRFFDRIETKDRQARDISSRAVESATVLAQSSAASTIRSFWILSAVLLIVAILVGTVVGRSIIRPLNRLRNVAIEMGKGNYCIRTNVETDDEIGALARSIDQLAGSLDSMRKSESNRNSERVERH